MAVLFPFVTSVIISFLIRNNMSNAHCSKYDDENYKDKLLMDAGCTRTCNNTEYGSGHLLAKGVCILYRYKEWVVPEKGLTTVYSTIEYQKVRSVDFMKETASIDYTLTLRWMDPAIKTKFSEEDKQNGGIVLDKSVGLKNWIWIPDMYIYNLSTFYYTDLDSRQIKGLMILTTNEFNQENTKTNNTKQDTKTVVELKQEIKSTVYCDFDLSAYPMDKQTCQLRFGSASLGATFVLYDPKHTFHNSITYQSANLHMTITFLDGHNMPGININMTRVVKPFIMKYYLPCIAIVFVSQLSFIIPPSAIPGRVALLVTVFLTLTNLYIQQLNESPSESGFNALGIYFLCSLAFVVGAMIEFSTLVLFNRLLPFPSQLMASEEDLKENRGVPKVMKKRTQRCEVKNTQKINDSEVLEESIYIQELEKDLRFRPQNINAIDFTAFWGFLLIYLLFNVAYWVHYSDV